jgi:KaiC/GvpD/RAD55 family RecA-like ATPase
MGMPLFEDRPIVKDLETEKGEYPIKRIPTGVPDFDQIIKGGVPSGSVILLLGEDGAGHQEYIYTSVAKIQIAKKYPESSTYFLGTRHYDALPERICYITFSRSKEDVVQEVGTTFNYDFYTIFKDDVLFRDFSRQYFKNTIVPPSWTTGDSHESLFESRMNLGAPTENPGLLENMVDFLEDNAKNSLVVIDSLTDLVISEAVSLHDLVTTLKGLRRVAKSWDCVIYLLLTKGIMDKRDQQMVVDGVDGVFIFEWSSYHKSSKRQRYMYVEKFTSLLAHLERKRIARFPIMISSKGGLIIIYLDLIS